MVRKISVDSEMKLMMNMPIAVILAHIEANIRVLNKRGIAVRDFDDNTRVLKQIRMIGGKAYFLTEKEAEQEGGFKPCKDKLIRTIKENS